MSCLSESEDDDYMCGWQRVAMRQQKAAEAHAEAVRQRHLSCKRKMSPIPAAEAADQPQMMSVFTSRMCTQPTSIGVRCTESPSKLLRTY
jgi:hypothetical protein